MFAGVVREQGAPEQIDGSGPLLEANVVPRARQAPEIVSAYWTTDRAGGTLNVLVFETEDAAQAAMDRVRNAPRPPGIELRSVDLHEVLAHL